MIKTSPEITLTAAFSFEQRLAFTKAVLIAADEAVRSALGGKLTVLIIKQLKGGVHARGAKSHKSAMHTLDNPDIVNALKARALAPAAWELVRTNFERAGGGPASRTAVTSALPLPDLGELPRRISGGGAPKVATTTMGRLVGLVESDRNYLVPTLTATLWNCQHQPSFANHPPHA